MPRGRCQYRRHFEVGLILLAGLAFGAWEDLPLPTNAPLAWTDVHPIGVCSQLFEAVDERCLAVGSNRIARPLIVETFKVERGDGTVTNMTVTNAIGAFTYQSAISNVTLTAYPPVSRYFLEQLDLKMLELTPYFVCTNYYTDSYAPWFDLRSGGQWPTDFPYESVGGLMYRCGIGTASNLTTNAFGLVSGTGGAFSQQPTIITPELVNERVKYLNALVHTTSPEWRWYQSYGAITSETTYVENFTTNISDSFETEAAWLAAMPPKTQYADSWPDPLPVYTWYETPLSPTATFVDPVDVDKPASWFSYSGIIHVYAGLEYTGPIVWYDGTTNGGWDVGNWLYDPSITKQKYETLAENYRASTVIVTNLPASIASEAQWYGYDMTNTIAAPIVLFDTAAESATNAHASILIHPYLYSNAAVVLPTGTVYEAEQWGTGSVSTLQTWTNVVSTQSVETAWSFPAITITKTITDNSERNLDKLVGSGWSGTGQYASISQLNAEFGPVDQYGYTNGTHSVNDYSSLGGGWDLYFNEGSWYFTATDMGGPWSVYYEPPDPPPWIGTAGSFAWKYGSKWLGYVDGTGSRTDTVSTITLTPTNVIGYTITGLGLPMCAIPPSPSDECIESTIDTVLVSTQVFTYVISTNSNWYRQVTVPSVYEADSNISISNSITITNFYTYTNTAAVIWTWELVSEEPDGFYPFFDFAAVQEQEASYTGTAEKRVLDTLLKWDFLRK